MTSTSVTCEILGIRRNVGWIENGSVFVSPRSPKNYFRSLGGFGMSEKVLDFLFYELDIEQIRIPCASKEYNSSVLMFKASGLNYDNQGDKQKVLPLKLFNLKGGDLWKH